jgi:hypothetical protein
MNGFFTDAIVRERGLRQGDPLSPLLFNYVLEPFLLSLLQDQDFEDLRLPPHFKVYNYTIHPLSIQAMQCLAYANNVCVLFKCANDLDFLQYHMQRYADVSNTKFNDDKSRVFSLNSQFDSNWAYLMATQNISKYYHQGSPLIIRYPGFHLPHIIARRATLEAQGTRREWKGTCKREENTVLLLLLLLPILQDHHVL